MSNSSTKTERANLIPTPGARVVTQPKRGRGRPRKNPVAQPAPVADPVMKMVEDYRDIQNKIKALNEELGPIKDALTRHLVAGDEDKIELTDGSYVISKVMVATWTYSEKLEAKRIKLEEQKLDLKTAEKKEQLNGSASATFSAHVRGRAK
tara:strand:- start:915 stop:1367 length:453 start_codon:yes stop_codon:yes gene_type:complete